MREFNCNLGMSLACSSHNNAHSCNDSIVTSKLIWSWGESLYTYNMNIFVAVDTSVHKQSGTNQ